MSAWVSRTARAAKRAGVRGGVVLAGAAILVGGLLVGSASAVTFPRPAAGFVPGASTDLMSGDSIHIFYQQANHSLTTVLCQAASECFGPQNLGGVLTSGPAAISIQGSGPSEEFANTWVFARGADNAVWYREYVGARGSWGPWTSLGGRAVGAPGVTCLGGPASSPTVFVRGTDGALWQRALSGGWVPRGGHLASPPAALLAGGGTCPSSLDAFALGTDHAVWEFTGAWHRVGGTSAVAPAALRLPSGETDLFARGTDNALWMDVRAPGAAAWQGWRRIGGVLTSAPAAAIWPYGLFTVAPRGRTVLALGSDGNLWIARNVVGTSTWEWGRLTQ